MVSRPLPYIAFIRNRKHLPKLLRRIFKNWTFYFVRWYQHGRNNFFGRGGRGGSISLVSTFSFLNHTSVEDNYTKDKTKNICKALKTIFGALAPSPSCMFSMLPWFEKLRTRSGLHRRNFLGDGRIAWFFWIQAQSWMSRKTTYHVVGTNLIVSFRFVGFVSALPGCLPEWASETGTVNRVSII